MASRSDRIAALQSTTKEYIRKEKERIENEVSVLEAVLRGRTGGTGIQQNGTAVVEAVAKRSLADFLKEA